MTRAVILAAGEGTRLRPLTDQIPKALVQLAGTSLLERQLRVLRGAGIVDIGIVVGYQRHALEGFGLRVFSNPEYSTTNMVASLACARDLFDGKDDVIVAYSDIVYEPQVLHILQASSALLAVVVDLNWLDLWSLRMDAPLADAETMKLDESGDIIELGQRPTSMADIQGQYIGLFKLDRSFAPQFLAAFDAMNPEDHLDGRPKEKIFMTSYLQLLIDQGIKAKAACVKGGWLEVDSVQDLQRYEAAHAAGRLGAIYKIETP